MKSLFLIFLIFAFQKVMAQTTCIAPGSSNECMIVKNNNILEKDRYGHLIKGTLAKSYTVEPQVSYFSNQCLIIVQKGDIIEYFRKDSDYGNSGYTNLPYSGTLKSCTIRNLNGIYLPVFGYSSSIPFPNGTKVVFEACAGHNNRYELVRVAEATLGADCDISNIGHVKKGQTISFWSGALDCVNMEGHSVN